MLLGASAASAAPRELFKERVGGDGNVILLEAHITTAFTVPTDEFMQIDGKLVQTPSSPRLEEFDYSLSRRDDRYALERRRDGKRLWVSGISADHLWFYRAPAANESGGAAGSKDNGVLTIAAKSTAPGKADLTALRALVGTSDSSQQLRLLLGYGIPMKPGTCHWNGDEFEGEGAERINRLKGKASFDSSGRVRSASYLSSAEGFPERAFMVTYSEHDPETGLPRRIDIDTATPSPGVPTKQTVVIKSSHYGKAPSEAFEPDRILNLDSIPIIETTAMGSTIHQAGTWRYRSRSASEVRRWLPLAGGALILLPAIVLFLRRHRTS